MKELEIVPHRHSDSVRIFINNVEYRSAHFHPEWELLWVLDTPLSITAIQKQYLIQPGELILFPPNFPHEFHKMERPCTFLCMQLSSKMVLPTANIRTEDIRLRDYLTEQDDLWLRSAMLQAAHAFFRQEEFSSLFYHGLSGMILHKLLSLVPFHIMTPEELASTEQRNTRLMRLIQFVDENYMRKIRLSDFAARENCSVSYMSHFVKDTMNQTFQNYVNSVRFNRARQMILQGSDSLVSISVASGFSDYRYFSQTFLKHYGMTPAEYRHHALETLPTQLSRNHSLHSREEIYGPQKALMILEQFQDHVDP